MQLREKLNWLHRHLPDSLVVDASWLESQGYSRGLRAKYVAGGWLEPLARGVYRRPVAALEPTPQPALRWETVAISLQALLQKPFVVGGRTALELQGFAHYLPMDGPREVHLYGARTAPAWLAKLDATARFKVHNSRRLFEGQEAVVRLNWGPADWPLMASSPERAILEMVDELPARESFHQVDVVMEGLVNLSPRRLQQLLVQCRSVKVKRLFLWLAARHNHAWNGRLDRQAINLGQGRRMIVRGGRLDPHYNITVPDNLDAGG